MADDVDGSAPGEALASRVRARLSELGRELPTVAAPVAAYVPAVRTGRYVQTSGQLPLVDGALPATGKGGAEATDAPAAGGRARRSELGRDRPTVAAPVAAYVPAVRTGRYVQPSGQLPLVDGALPATGKVGAEVSLEQAAELAALSCLNALAAIEA